MAEIDSTVIIVIVVIAVLFLAFNVCILFTFKGSEVRRPFVAKIFQPPLI